jgi:5-methyltetrahydropteroyltriglutamate--homocysteine methyltransferase
MSKIGAFIHGVYPRSKELVQVSRDFDRKRLSISDLEKQRGKDFEELLNQQKKAGFDFLEDGKFSWQDIFRPIVEATDGMEVGALTRWFDNNSFYRQPIINGKLKLNEKKLDKFFEKIPVAQWKVTIPSPFTFAKLADNTTSSSFEKTLGAITDIYVQVISYLNLKKVAFVQFNEPFIPYHKVKKSEIILLTKSLQQLKKSKGNLVLALHGYFGDTANLVTSLSENSAIDVLGIDFVNTSLTSIPKKLSSDIIAGVVDGRSSLLEEKYVLKNFVEKALKHFGDKKIYLSNNSDLDLLPEAVAKEKIRLLGEIRKEFSI